MHARVYLALDYVFLLYSPSDSYPLIYCLTAKEGLSLGFSYFLGNGSKLVEVAVIGSVFDLLVKHINFEKSQLINYKEVYLVVSVCRISHQLAKEDFESEEYFVYSINSSIGNLLGYLYLLIFVYLRLFSYRRDMSENWQVVA